MQLTLRITKYWFEKIKSGEKKIEYRKIKPFYAARIEGKEITELKLIAGYSKESPVLIVQVERVEKNNGNYEFHLT